VQAEENSPLIENGQQTATCRKMRKWVILLITLVTVLLLGFGYLLLASKTSAATKALSWRIQPDQFPLGTVLQGSRIELSFGTFSGLRAGPLPGFVTALPSTLRKPCDWGIQMFRKLKTQSEWRVNVEAPDFMKVDDVAMQFHTSEGPFAFVSATLKTARPGQYNGNLVVRLSSAAYTATNIVVPVSATVVSPPALPRKVLICETPYECYSTGNGRDFEPLGKLLTSLAEKAVSVDFYRELPSSFSGYSVVLVGGASLARLSPAQVSKLGKFVSGGGRLILTPDAFLSTTAPKANELLRRYGLEIIDKDFGLGITNTTVTADSLTTGVRRLDFWRPAPIKVSDSSQARLLVQSEDGGSGFVAVSRSPNRGEVIALTQSLWWNWIRQDPTRADNSLLLENLLSNYSPGK
jgi:hypothetical protein